MAKAFLPLFVFLLCSPLMGYDAVETGSTQSEEDVSDVERNFQLRVNTQYGFQDFNKNWESHQKISDTLHDNHPEMVKCIDDLKSLVEEDYFAGQIRLFSSMNRRNKALQTLSKKYSDTLRDLKRIRLELMVARVEKSGLDVNSHDEELRISESWHQHNEVSVGDYEISYSGSDISYSAGGWNPTIYLSFDEKIIFDRAINCPPFNREYTKRRIQNEIAQKTEQLVSHNRELMSQTRVLLSRVQQEIAVAKSRLAQQKRTAILREEAARIAEAEDSSGQEMENHRRNSQRNSLAD